MKKLYIQEKISTAVFFWGVEREVSPCSSFKRYKGKRFPTCMCQPCFDKFLEANKATTRELRYETDGSQMKINF